MSDLSDLDRISKQNQDGLIFPNLRILFKHKNVFSYVHSKWRVSILLIIRRKLTTSYSSWRFWKPSRSRNISRCSYKSCTVTVNQVDPDTQGTSTVTEIRHTSWRQSLVDIRLLPLYTKSLSWLKWKYILFGPVVVSSNYSDPKPVLKRDVVDSVSF